MAQSLYWYDLETSGTNPRWDRIVQFAGMRTDLDLNPIDDEYCTYVRWPDDVLPNPQASLVTGLTPALANRQGVSEFEALDRIRSIFSKPQTCVAGYNNLRFDDEFIRYGFYRMLMDPYTREWQNHNSRWDIIDLVRGTGALRREGITWPTTEEGLPIYKLELLTKANGLEHGQAHDAMSDVRATVDLARLLKRAQPRLYEFFFNNRRKKQARQLLEPYGARVCIHVSGMYPREQFGSAPVVSLCRHPTNSNSIVVVDLSQDIESLLKWSPEEIREKLFTPGVGISRPPLKEIRINRCPFVAGIEVLDDENWTRLGFNRKDIDARRRRLKQPGLVQKIMRVYTERPQETSLDPEAALYDAFLQDADRSRCNDFLETVQAGGWSDLDFQDKRLPVLASRLKSRSFADRMSDSEAADWHDFVSRKLYAMDAPWLTLPRYFDQLEELRQAVSQTDAPARDLQLIDELVEHGRSLEQRYA